MKKNRKARVERLVALNCKPMVVALSAAIVDGTLQMLLNDGTLLEIALNDMGMTEADAADPVVLAGGQDIYFPASNMSLFVPEVLAAVDYGEEEAGDRVA